MSEAMHNMKIPTSREDHGLFILINFLFPFFTNEFHQYQYQDMPLILMVLELNC